jgi:hypothetical protein
MESNYWWDGALTVAGGAGIGGNLNVKGNTNINRLDVSGTIRAKHPGDSAAMLLSDNNIGNTDYGTLTISRPTNNKTRPSIGVCNYNTTTSTNDSILQMGFLKDSNNFGLFTNNSYTNGDGNPAICLEHTNKYVGIGKKSPSYNLDVSGSVILNKLIINEVVGTDATTTDGSLIINHNNLSGVSSIVFPSPTNTLEGRFGDYGYIKYKDNYNNTEDGRLIIGIENDAAGTNIKDSIIIFPAKGEGFVGINKMDPTTNLDVSGSLTVSGTVSAASYNATSDYRIKKNITSLNENYTIDELEPKYYYNSMNGKYEVGFIAHEIETKYPFLVNGKKDDECYQSINYNGIIGLLTNEIKMLKKEMSILKEEMRTIKGFK